MHRRVGRHRKLEATIAAGALIETRARTRPAHIAPGDCDRALVTTGMANSPGRPHHAFQQSPTLLLISKATTISSAVRMLVSAASIPDILISFGSPPKNRTAALEHQASCCLWLIKAMYRREFLRQTVPTLRAFAYQESGSLQVA